MKLSTLLLSLILLLNSCDNREQKLRKKEMELIQKEQELLLREKELQLREQQLTSQQRVNTNENKNNSVKNQKVTGSWTAQMTCIETDCEGSAIGDTKNEQWEISNKNNIFLAKAMAKNKLVRVYSGELHGNIFELSAEQNAAESSAQAKMLVKLKVVSATRMEGRREIFREGCKIIYSLELNKQ